MASATERASVRRVLLISGEYPPMEGGVADFTHLLALAMAEWGAEVHVLTSLQGRASPEGEGVHCHPLLASCHWAPLYRAVRRLLQQVHPDVVNIQYQAAAYGMHPAINLLPFFFRSVPTVVTFHDLLAPYLFPKAGPLRWQANLALARFARACIATNAQDSERLAAHSWIDRIPPQNTAHTAERPGHGHKVYLAQIPIGSNIVNALPSGYDRAAWRRRLGLAEDVLVLCYFGFLNSSKGGEELIEALDSLAQRGYNVALLMIGGAVGASDPTNRSYLDTVVQSIEEKNLAERVTWTGYLEPPEVSASFAVADICVLPYRDGASFRRGSFMAALAHGMPIVSTYPQVVLPELVHGENVWLVPPHDARALSEALVRLASDDLLRQCLGVGALALSKQFGWRPIAARTLEVYHAVADPGGPGA
jgi:glycosyltransferase involved in cell wall biosynthesis